MGHNYYDDSRTEREDWIFERQVKERERERFYKVYRHAKFECNSLNIVRDIASYKNSQVLRALVTLNEGQNHRTVNGHLPSKLAGHCLNSF